MYIREKDADDKLSALENQRTRGEAVYDGYDARDNWGDSSGAEEGDDPHAIQRPARAHVQVYATHVVVGAAVAAKSIRWLLQVLGSNIIFVTLDPYEPRHAGAIRTTVDERRGALRRLLKADETYNGLCYNDRGCGFVLWRKNQVEDIELSEVLRAGRHEFAVMSAKFRQNTWQKCTDAPFYMGHLYRIADTRNSNSPMSEVLADSIKEVVKKMEVRLVGGFFDIPHDQFVDLCRGCGATPPSAFAQFYYTKTSLTPQQWKDGVDDRRFHWHPSYLFTTGPANVTHAPVGSQPQLPDWLDQAQNAMGLAKFKSVWCPDSKYNYSEDDAFDESLPFLGDVKQKDADKKNQVSHMHHVTLYIDPPNRKGGRGAKERREALQKARKKGSGQDVYQ